ncbi:MAG: transcription repressor NadR [Firmicutes bacterium]|nr:transcription repressor NadR [Bacillota bacterium]
MKAKERRNNILDTLKKEKGTIKGTNLADKYSVSRQVIVQDIAILRAKGQKILATPQGYMILTEDNNKILKTIASKHNGYDAIEDELKTIIDLGGKVLDVIVEHPIYGDIKGNLMLNSRMEIDDFIRKIKSEQAEPLATLTDGVHIHTIEVPNEEVFKKIQEMLKEKKYLIENK